MKKRTVFFLAACLCSPFISPAEKVQAAVVGGALTAWWVGSDYTNTNSASAVSWYDRVSNREASAVAGSGVYPVLNADQNGVTFTRSGESYKNAGSYFTVSSNPITGQKDFTILVEFAPSALGCTGGGAFYQDSGLVAAEQAGVVPDWGLGYDSAGHIVGGYGKGNNGGDLTYDSAQTITPGTSAIVGMSINGTTLSLWNDGENAGNRTGVTVSGRNNTPMLIGRMGADGGYYAGDISEILIFTRALSEKEIRIYTDMMANDSGSFVWESGTGNWTDASWTSPDGTKTTLPANTTAFINAGTVTMEAAPAAKALFVGTGDANAAAGSAVLNASNETLAGAEDVLILKGGELKLSTTTYSADNVELAGGTINGLRAIAATDKMAVLTVTSGTFTTGGPFDVGGYEGTGSGKLIINGGTVNGTAGYFCVGNRSTGEGIVEQNGGTVNTNWITIGHKTKGSYTLNGGKLAITYMTLGEGTNTQTGLPQTTGVGTFTINGGTFTASDYVSVGKSSASTFTMTGGTASVPRFEVTGNGTFNLSNGTANLNTVNSSGNINMTGGTLNASAGINLNGKTFSYAGGTITTPRIQINSGGTFKTDKTFLFGDTSTQQEILLTGGTFTSTIQNVYIGNSGKAKLTLKSGNIAFQSSHLTMGGADGGDGVFEVSGGNAAVQSLNIGRDGTGLMNMTGGNFSTSYYFSIADNPKGKGDVSISGGNLSAGHLSVGNRGAGTYDQTGGFMQASHLYIGQNVNASGELTLSGGGVLKVANTALIQGNGTGSMTLSGDAIFQMNTLSNADKLTFEGGTLLTKNINGNLTQTGGVLEAGGNVSNGLTWTRQKWTGVTDAFPGYTKPATDESSYSVPTQEQVDAFWEKARNAKPSASGIGSLTSGLYEAPYYSTLFDGMIYIDKTDTYTFNFKVDDGGFLYIDGQKVAEMSTLNSSNPWNFNSKSTPITLEAGWHSFNFDFYQGWGGYGITTFQMVDSEGNAVDLRETTNPGVSMISLSPEYTDLRVNGNYVMGKEATLLLDADLMTGEHDSLIVTGSADLDGNLFLLLNGANPYVSDLPLFKTEDGGTLDFNFANIDIVSAFDDSVWDISGLLAGGDGILRLDRGAVPEPSTWILLVLGAAGLWISRRKAAKEGMKA